MARFDIDFHQLTDSGFIIELVFITVNTLHFACEVLAGKSDCREVTPLQTKRRGGSAPSPPMQPIDSPADARRRTLTRPSIGRTSGFTPVRRPEGSFRLLAQPEKEMRKGKRIDTVISGHVPVCADTIQGELMTWHALKELSSSILII
jgi:hypothetical protein